MDGKTLARLGAIVFVAVAITATAIEMSRKEETPETWPSGRVTETRADPLHAELVRCQALGEAGQRDTACLKAWAESRNRFLAPGARPPEGQQAPQAPSAVPAEQPALEPLAAPPQPEVR